MRASGEVAAATRETTIAAGTLAPGTVAAQRIAISGMRDGKALLRFRVDGNAPPGVTLRMPIALQHMAVNAVPHVCAAAPGIRSALDLPRIMPTLG